MLGTAEAIVFTILGSLAVLILDVLKQLKLPRAQWPEPSIKDPVYWLVQLLLNPALALIAALVCVYGNQPLTSFTAIALGAGAPVFVQKIIDNFKPTPPAPPTPPGA